MLLLLVQKEQSGIRNDKKFNIKPIHSSQKQAESFSALKVNISQKKVVLN